MIYVKRLFIELLRATVFLLLQAELVIFGPKQVAYLLSLPNIGIQLAYGGILAIIAVVIIFTIVLIYSHSAQATHKRLNLLIFWAAAIVILTINVIADYFIPEYNLDLYMVGQLFFISMANLIGTLFFQKVLRNNSNKPNTSALTWAHFIAGVYNTLLLIMLSLEITRNLLDTSFFLAAATVWQTFVAAWFMVAFAKQSRPLPASTARRQMNVLLFMVFVTGVAGLPFYNVISVSNDLVITSLLSTAIVAILHWKNEIIPLLRMGSLE